MHRLITRNWSLKLLALITGIGLWLFVVGQGKTEISVRVPVELSHISKEVLVVGEVIKSLDLRLYGPPTVVRKVIRAGLTKVVDLSGKGPGEHVFQMGPDEFRLPLGVTVNRVTPSRFTVTLAKREGRLVPVRPVLSGKPDPGLEVTEVTFEPDRVNIYGTGEELKALDWIWTMPIELKGLSGEHSFQVDLRVPDGKSLSIEPTTVTATIKLRPKAAKPRGAPGKKNGAAAKAKKGPK